MPPYPLWAHSPWLRRDWQPLDTAAARRAITATNPHLALPLREETTVALSRPLDFTDGQLLALTDRRTRPLVSRYVLTTSDMVMPVDWQADSFAAFCAGCELALTAATVPAYLHAYFSLILPEEGAAVVVESAADLALMAGRPVDPGPVAPTPIHVAPSEEGWHVGFVLCFGGGLLAVDAMVARDGAITLFGEEIMTTALSVTWQIDPR